MLPELHESLRRLIYERGQISPLDVDILFEAPRRDWVDRLMRPAINLYLFDVQENVKRRSNQMESRVVNGRAIRSMAPRQIDLHYMVSALTTEITDEHLLIWRTLSTLMKYRELPDELLPESLRGASPAITTQIAQPDEGIPLSQIWSGLSADARPALYYVVTVPLDLDLAIEAPLVLTRTLRYTRLPDLAASDADTQIGGTVRDRAGAPVVSATIRARGSAAADSVTDSEGRFTIRHATPGPVILDVVRSDGKRQSVTVQVPSDSYDIVFD
ncbi:MAG: Pvc16 family protein [Thermomicrobia bacterium]|nr:Pvc16 family protein [Thermomicrobia bacterium]